MEPAEDYRRILAELYQAARTVPPGYALDMTRHATTDEERNFYAYICDMNMQRKQREVIRNEETYYRQK